MRYELWYNAPAPTIGDELRVHDGALDPNDGWEKWSLPIGCGWSIDFCCHRLVRAKLQSTCQRWVFECFLRCRWVSAHHGEKQRKSTLSGIFALVHRW